MSLSELKDLRRTNLVMGGDSNKDDLSNYYRDYRPWELQTVDQRAQTFKFQKTNLVIGENEGPDNWSSTQNRDFIKHDHSDQPKLNEERKRELRSHQYNFGRARVTLLGNWNGSKISEFADEFTTKRADLDHKNGEILKNKLRKHNFQLGEPAAKMANTTYDTAYVAHPKDALNLPNNEELRKKVVELRNTNLILGQDPSYNTTTMQRDYQKIDNFEPTKLNRARLQKTHFEMGDFDPQMTSMNRTYFKAHKYDPSGSVENEKRELIADLRSKQASSRASLRLRRQLERLRNRLFGQLQESRSQRDSSDRSEPDEESLRDRRPHFTFRARQLLPARHEAVHSRHLQAGRA
jgi:hypothetical protein